MTAQRLRILASVHPEHLPEQGGCRPVGQQSGELRPQPIQLRSRAGLRRPFHACPGRAAARTAEAGQPDRDLAEQRGDRVLAIVLHATLLQGYANPLEKLDTSESANLHKCLILLDSCRIHATRWQPKGKNTIVNVYDFINLGDGKAAPYGVYDVVHNTGFVNVGVDHDTASFAVESIRRWWNNVGRALYPKKTRLLITSDGGGSNGVRNRLWKKELQQLANDTGLSITVNHLPPATSKWNKIEHRLFSHISINWRGKPLTSLETIIELLSHTTTQQGLTVTAVVDQNSYPTGIKVSDEEMSRLNIERDTFHGDWNYTMRPHRVPARVSYY